MYSADILYNPVTHTHTHVEALTHKRTHTLGEMCLLLHLLLLHKGITNPHKASQPLKSNDITTLDVLTRAERAHYAGSTLGCSLSAVRSSDVFRHQPPCCSFINTAWSHIHPPPCCGCFAGLCVWRVWTGFFWNHLHALRRGVPAACGPLLLTADLTLLT